MIHTLDKIESKLSDYIVCENCFGINWYENKECIFCNSNKLYSDDDMVYNWVKDERSFWESEGYAENKINNIEIQI